MFSFVTIIIIIIISKLKNNEESVIMRMKAHYVIHAFVFEKKKSKYDYISVSCHNNFVLR